MRRMSLVKFLSLFINLVACDVEHGFTRALLGKKENSDTQSSCTMTEDQVLFVGQKLRVEAVVRMSWQAEQLRARLIWRVGFHPENQLDMTQVDAAWEVWHASKASGFTQIHALARVYFPNRRVVARLTVHKATISHTIPHMHTRTIAIQTRMSWPLRLEVVPTRRVYRVSTYHLLETTDFYRGGRRPVQLWYLTACYATSHIVSRAHTHKTLRVGERRDCAGRYQRVQRSMEGDFPRRGGSTHAMESTARSLHIRGHGTLASSDSKRQRSVGCVSYAQS